MKSVSFILMCFVLCTALVFGADEPSKQDSLFTQFIVRGGVIVYYILIPMSLLTIGRIVELFVLIRRKRLIPADIAGKLIMQAKNSTVEKMKERLSSQPDLISQAVHRALVQAHHSGAERRYLQHVAIEGLHDAAMRLLRKVELCNIIGNVAPMVGLFGTVFGMIQAFSLLGIAGGQPKPDLLAAKISVALVTTFWGLLIAIPALTMYGVFRTRVEGLVSEAVIEVELVLHQIRLPVQPNPVRHSQQIPKQSAGNSGSVANGKRPLRRKRPMG